MIARYLTARAVEPVATQDPAPNGTTAALRTPTPVPPQPTATPLPPRETPTPAILEAATPIAVATQTGAGTLAPEELRAIDISTGRIVWELAQVGTGDTWGGVLSTASGLVFVAEDDGTFTAVDARSGERLWQFAANASWRGSPMTYVTSARQYVAIAGGGVVYAFALPDVHQP